MSRPASPRRALSCRNKKGAADAPNASDDASAILRVSTIVDQVRAKVKPRNPFAQQNYAESSLPAKGTPKGHANCWRFKQTGIYPLVPGV
jgi:hypothetical protein